jgi:hypothetical protein
LLELWPIWATRFPIKRLAMLCAAVLILFSLDGTSAHQLWRRRGACAYMTNVENRKMNDLLWRTLRGRARLPSVHCLSCLTRRPVARCCMGPRRRVSATRAPRLSGGWLRVTTQTGRNVRRSLVARSMLGLATSRPKLQFCGPPPLSLTLHHKPLSAQFTVGSFWGEGTIVVLQTVQDVIDVLGGSCSAAFGGSQGTADYRSPGPAQSVTVQALISF